MRIIRLVGFFALLSLLSCDVFRKEPPPCPEIAGLFFTPFDAHVKSQRITPCCNTQLNAFERVSFNEFNLCLHYEANYHAFKPDISTIFQAAYASTCPENGQNGSKIALDEIEIITLYDIDDSHKKGSPVNDLFEFAELGSRLFLPAYLSSDDRRIRDENAQLYLIQEPALSDTCAFKINVLLDNGKKFTCISTPVIFE